MVHWTLGLASAAGAMGWEGYRRGNWPVMKQRCRHFSVMDRTCQQSEGEPVKSCPEAGGPSGMFSLAHQSSLARVIILLLLHQDAKTLPLLINVGASPSSKDASLPNKCSTVSGLSGKYTFIYNKCSLRP